MEINKDYTCLGGEYGGPGRFPDRGLQADGPHRPVPHGGHPVAPVARRHHPRHVHELYLHELGYAAHTHRPSGVLDSRGRSRPAWSRGTV